MAKKKSSKVCKYHKKNSQILIIIGLVAFIGGLSFSLYHYLKPTKAGEVLYQRGERRIVDPKTRPQPTDKSYPTKPIRIGR
jgi:hypothetical protein